MTPTFGEPDDFEYLFLVELTEPRDNILSVLYRRVLRAAILFQYT